MFIISTTEAAEIYIKIFNFKDGLYTAERIKFIRTTIFTTDIKK